MKPAFTSFQESTAEDWAVISEQHAEFTAQLPHRVIAHLRLLEGDFGGFPVDRLTHSLQTAQRAARAGRDDQYVLCALLHDIGDTLAPTNHAELAAVILRPYVSAENTWMVDKHAIFQGYYFFHHLGGDRELREQYRDHPWFDRTAEFCLEFDQASFDPSYPTPPLEEFVPLVHQLLGDRPHASS